MPIATIGVTVTVTPADEIAVARGAGDCEYVNDRSPFTLSVREVLCEQGVVIAVVGPVIAGPSRYAGLVATLLTRLEGSHWECDMHSAANFKVGPSPARRIADFPHYHPDGTEVDGYPVIMRYGRVDAAA